jgi:opacity protein-like surface antigen
MKRTKIIVALAAVASGLAYAADAPMSTTLNTEQAQARQFGIYFGGTASQYDLCVKKGFLSKGDQSAEEFVKAALEQMRALNKGPDESAYVQEGWDMIKKEIAENDGFFTHDKCAAVGKEWTKMLASMHKK